MGDFLSDDVLARGDVGRTFPVDTPKAVERLNSWEHADLVDEYGGDFHELLGLQPDHLPSLKALARASDQANHLTALGNVRAAGGVKVSAVSLARTTDFDTGYVSGYRPMSVHALDVRSAIPQVKSACSCGDVAVEIGAGRPSGSVKVCA